jgi:hypothetical protein
MSHFYFPAHDLVLLHAKENGQAVTASYYNRPVNLDQILTFLPGLERYNFASNEAAQRALYAPVPAIRFRVPGATPHVWLFSDESSRDAELRALNNHLVNKGS